MAIFEKGSLNEEELKDVNGGAIFKYGVSDGWEVATAYEVIDDNTGEVMETFYDDYAGASDYAFRHGMSDQILDWSQLKALREKNNK